MAKIRVGPRGRTSNEHARLVARLMLLNALNSHTFILRDLAELGFEPWKERYPRLANRPWVIECLSRNLETWDRLPEEYRGRLLRLPLDGEYLPHCSLKTQFAFDLKADEKTMTEATKELKAEFRKWCTSAGEGLVAELRAVYTSGRSLPPKVEEDHFVWAALFLAGKRDGDRGYGFTIEEVAGGERSDGLDPRGVQRAIKKVLNLTDLAQ